MNAPLLPVEPAWRLAQRPAEQRWLVTGLWSEQAVGIVGGEPKCCKSFLALDLAVAVASGTPCLRHFAVPHPGRVLLYAAEDALAQSGLTVSTNLVALFKALGGGWPAVAPAPSLAPATLCRPWPAEEGAASGL